MLLKFLNRNMLKKFLFHPLLCSLFSGADVCEMTCVLFSIRSDKGYVIAYFPLAGSVDVAENIRSYSLQTAVLNS